MITARVASITTRAQDIPEQLKKNPVHFEWALWYSPVPPDGIQGPYPHSTLWQEKQILYINQFQSAPRTGPACALDKAEKLIKTWHMIKTIAMHIHKQGELEVFNNV